MRRRNLMSRKKNRERRSFVPTFPARDVTASLGVESRNLRAQDRRSRTGVTLAQSPQNQGGLKYCANLKNAPLSGKFLLNCIAIRPPLLYKFCCFVRISSPSDAVVPRCSLGKGFRSMVSSRDLCAETTINTCPKRGGRANEIV
jgi:hypothetical protein